MDENKLMLFDTNDISRYIILERVNEFYAEYGNFPTRIYVPKTLENKWASLGKAEWDRLAGEIFVSGLRTVFEEPPVFSGSLLIFWDSDKYAIERKEEDVERLCELGYDVSMHNK